MRLHIIGLAVWLLANGASAQASPYTRAIEQAVAAYNAGQFEAARAHFGDAHALRPNARTWRGMGSSDFELARWPEAAEELTQALADERSPLTAELRTRTEAQLETARAHLPPPVVAPEPEPLPVVVEQAPEPMAPVPEPPRRRFGVLRGLAVGSLVVGVAGFALATGYGLRSINEGDTRDKYCDDSGACGDPRGVDAGNEARRTGNLATAGWIIGGVGLAGAVALFWTGRAQRDRLSLRLGPTSLALAGTL